MSDFEFQEVISYHEHMAKELQEAARIAIMETDRGLYVSAGNHARWARALRELQAGRGNAAADAARPSPGAHTS